MSISTVFFDLDDTLVATTATRIPRARLALDLLTRAGHKVDWESFVAAIHRLNDRGDFILGMEGAIADLGLSRTPIGDRAIATWFFEDCKHLIQPHEGVIEALQQLAADFTLGVITNGPNDIQGRKFRVLGLESHIRAELLITSEIAGCYKPDPRIFQHALESTGVEPREAVMVGDWALGDVGGAQAAGMRGVWFNPEGHPAPEGVSPDATISRFAELPELLRAWGV